MAAEYIIYCDESDEKGDYFSNFYGGTLIRGEHLQEIVTAIRAKKKELNLTKEVKWQRVTEHYEGKYTALMDTFFDFVKADKIKVRIMFTQNRYVAKGLTKRHIDEKYFILYYQFIKHAFGLNCSPKIPGGVHLKVYPDKIPDNAEKVAVFRTYIVGLARQPEMRERNIRINPDNVTDVDSREHEILQCLDVVLGSINFKLNNKHRALTARNNTRRGSRTKAKERIFNHIKARIQDIYPRFNVGSNTGQHTADCYWTDPYRHWLFVPRERIIVDISKHKKKK
ncbi:MULTISPECIES: DUF3800 domain-containing protein [Bradyrhizobium]|jgi:hypothetical protein|uniref:DUF3800 domain-containing protein n=1 Tax=Bradyrhizobium TaxID=374 RepID=UPI0004118B4D|nr:MULTISPECIES: DUF3800 domain-containing protein [Bradyrhizobium]KIU48981.1 hypothetical protein QU41_13695 [Bradyrhizobium elkanii]MBK5652484.1 DUF3800 domain-containing protein [Rhizobium sp.]OCX29172.1 hypothetical protein QU42_19780 [Bradyrhizobium sp. UASWS1016]